MIIPKAPRVLMDIGWEMSFPIQNLNVVIICFNGVATVRLRKYRAG